MTQERLRALWPWFFAPRDIELPSRIIRFPGSLERAPEPHYNPIENEWIRPAQPANFILSKWEGDWTCEIWKTTPSRFDSAITRIVYYWRYLVRFYWLKSDVEIGKDLQRRGEYGL